MNCTAVLGATALALLLTVVVLHREMRLRRALEDLLRRLLRHWRNYGPKDRMR